MGHCHIHNQAIGHLHEQSIFFKKQNLRALLYFHASHKLYNGYFMSLLSKLIENPNEKRLSKWFGSL
jgi:hypothetical protein